MIRLAFLAFTIAVTLSFQFESARAAIPVVSCNKLFVDAHDYTESAAVIREHIRILNKRGIESELLKERAGVEFGVLLEKMSRMEPQRFLKLFAIAIRDNPYPLNATTRRAFRTRVLKTAHQIGISPFQVDFIQRLFIVSRDEAEDLLDGSDWLD